MQELTSTAAVIGALGGVAPVAAMTGREYNAAENWKRFEHFPPDTYLVMTKALQERGCTAPASLWRMVPAEPEQVAS